MSGLDGTTNWGAYGVEAMWAMVADENSCENWNVPVGWDSMASALEAHRRNLLRAQELLEAAWPPEHNEGAAKFVSKIKGLIGSVENSALRAREISKATDAVMGQLATAQGKLQGLRERYQRESNDLVLSSWDHAEDEINAEARSVMVTAETAIRDHASAIVPPKQYAVDEVGNGPKRRHPPEPEVPPVGGDGLTGSRIPHREPFTAPHTPPPPLAGHDPVGMGIGLAGVAPSVAVLAQPGVLPIGAGPSPSVVPPSGLAMGLGVLPQPGGVIGNPGVGGPLRPAPMGPVSMRTAMPVGGVIGGGPGAGVGGGGVGGMPQGGLGRGSGARLTPGGGGQPGVLGAGGPGGTGAGNGMMGQGRGGRSTRSGELAERDPDNPWATAEGVDPVIEPDVRPVRHDPGPGVIGFDR